MRRYIVVLLTILFLSGALHAQTYRVYRPTSDTDSEKEIEFQNSSRFEIYGEGLYSFGSIKDRNADILTEKMSGARAGIRVGVGYNIMLGIEGEKLKASDQRTDAISTFQRKSWQATLKWTFTPDVNPKLYLITGVGRVKQDAQLRLMPAGQFKGDTSIWSLGVGGEVKIWKGLFAAGEYRMTYDTKRWDNFIFEAPHKRHEFSVGLRYSF